MEEPTKLELLLAEITLIAPAGARVSVRETLHSSDPPQYAATVHVDVAGCIRKDSCGSMMLAVVHFEPAPEKLVARIGAQVAQGQCGCITCQEARTAASIERQAEVA